MTYLENTHTTYDKLIAGVAVPVMTKNVTLKGDTATLKRGTVLALSNGKYEIVDTESETAEVKVANTVLAEDVDANLSEALKDDSLAEDVELTGDDAVATVYTAGLFNPDAMTVKASGDTVLAHEEELRIVGIYLAKAL